jgi:8-oxo-dGTP pyrophosphatase MutT (NUDIX family)
MSIASASIDPGPTLVDRAFQLGYTVAYRLMRTYWRLRHPVTHGALVAVWNAGEVLLVRNSYIPYYSAPGGYVRRNEEPRAAAARELAEEVGAYVSPQDLQLGIEVTHEWEYKLDHVMVFNLELAVRPQIQIDHREVVEATWFTPAEALKLDLFPPLKRVIEAKR